MRVAIIGAGAMGSMIGEALCRTGNQVTIIDRPQRISQIRAMGGLVVIDPAGHEHRSAPALLSSSPHDSGPHEVIFLATKAQDLHEVAPMVPVLANCNSCIVTIQNGIPWWYFHGLDHELRGTRLKSVDSDGSIERHVDSSQVVGCVAYPAAELMEDGRVKHIEGNRFPVGEIDNQARKRTGCLVQMLVEAGLKSRVLADIRSEIWLKAWGALSINPISAITRATMADICSFQPTRELVATMMREAQAVAECLGASFRHTIERRIDGAKAVGHHKTSMLQDLENGRPMELDALMLAVIEMADLVGREVPTIRNIYACVALLNDTALSAGRTGEDEYG